MKLKNIFAALFAATAVLVGCEDNEVSYLDEVKVSTSYVALPAEGGSVDVTVTAKADWSITGKPDWLKILPDTLGTAGESVITFEAEAATSTNEAKLYLNCLGKQQIINVLQMTEKVELQVSTCAEIIAGNDAVTYRAKGTCTAIANTTYGNWYLTDETGEIYIYGTLDAEGGTKNFTSLGLEVGDIVTVEGPKTTYGSTVELVDVTVISIEKSLIKVDSLSTSEQLPLEGADVTAYLTCKGDGVSVNVPEAAKSWLSVTGVKTSGTTAEVSFYAAANALGDRSATVTFVTTSGGKEYTAQTEISQKGAIIDATIAEILAAEDGDTQYRTTGYITKMANTTYGNYYIKDATGEIYVYGTLDAAGASKNFASLGISEGDIVTVVGPKTSYNGTAQMKNVTVEKHYAVTDLAVADFASAEESTEKWVRMTGKVSEIANATYGNLNLADDSGNSVYVYGVLAGWGGTKGKFADLGVAAGDSLTVVGNVSSYKGNKQLANAFYVSHKAGSGTTDPDPETPEVGADEYTIDLAYTLGENTMDKTSSYAQTAVVNTVTVDNVIKMGTGSKVGSVTFTIPSGTKSVSYYAVGWKDKTVTLTVTAGEQTIATQAIAANAGATGSAPYTLTVASTDKYTINLGSALTADTQVTVTTDNKGFRAILFGVKATK